MPAIATLEELKSVQTDIDSFKAAEPEAYTAMAELLKKHRKAGYKNICRITHSGKTWDLSKMNFENLKEEFKQAKHKNIEIADLRAFIKETT